MNDARLDLRLPKELLDRVKEAAGGSVNAWVRNVLEQALDGPLVGGARLATPKPTNADLGARMKVSRRLTPEGDVEEIPLPKIAPRRWGK